MLFVEYCRLEYDLCWTSARPGHNGICFLFLMEYFKFRVLNFKWISGLGSEWNSAITEPHNTRKHAHIHTRGVTQWFYLYLYGISALNIHIYSYLNPKWAWPKLEGSFFQLTLNLPLCRQKQWKLAQKCQHGLFLAQTVPQLLWEHNWSGDVGGAVLKMTFMGSMQLVVFLKI